MTGKEARVEAQSISGMTIDKNTALMWMKNAIRDIVSRYPDSAGKLTEEEFVAEGPGPHSLKNTIARVREAAVADEEGYRGFRILKPGIDFFVENDNSITVKKKGRYIISYYAIPDFGGTFNEDTQIPLPLMFQEAVKYKLAAEIRGRAIGMSDQETLVYESKYNDAILKAQIFMTRQNKKRMPPRKR
jgi:hypothetical protein